MRLLAIILLMGSLFGCSASPARLTDSTVPMDFTLEVRDSMGDGALFIVEPDRWFRAATGATPDGYFYPPATRLLTPEQMEAIWAAVQDSGVLDRGGGGADGPVLRIEVQVNHKRTGISFDSARDSDASDLLDLLYRLAWIEP